jgi:hypothetical protein
MEIKSHVSVGEIRFGEFREEVRKLIGSRFEEFRRSASSTNTSDHYVELGCFVYYDTENKVEAVELSKPANAIFDGVDLLDVSIESLMAFMRSHDSKIELESDGFVSNKTGVSAYIPGIDVDPDSPDLRAESILAFRPGYYGIL